eukprot:g1428.t1
MSITVAISGILQKLRFAKLHCRMEVVKKECTGTENLVKQRASSSTIGRSWLILTRWLSLTWGAWTGNDWHLMILGVEKP